MAIFILLVAAIHPTTARAHELVPSVADLTVTDDRVQLQIRTNLEALIADIGPDHDDTSQSANAQEYEGFRLLEPDALTGRFAEFEGAFVDGLTFEIDGVRQVARVDLVEVPDVGDVDIARTSRVTVSADMPAGATAVTFGWAPEFGQIVIRALNEQDEGYVTLLEPGEVTDAISLQEIAPPGWFAVLLDFLGNGYEHVLGFDAMETLDVFGLKVSIPTGLDHILFVIGLFLLSTRLGPLLWQITAFTVAHTVTLALGVMGWVNVSPDIIEPLIAASIVYVAVENMFTAKMNPWRPLVVFLFGLLHGLGFAGALGAFGIPGSQLLPSLLGFNIGVELGQLTVIALCFVLVGIWFGRKSWYRRVVVIPGSLIVALIGVYWFLERTILA